jgi:NaMN:DMB phosphoribosyltransferase
MVAGTTRKGRQMNDEEKRDMLTALLRKRMEEITGPSPTDERESLRQKLKDGMAAITGQTESDEKDD